MPRINKKFIPLLALVLLLGLALPRPALALFGFDIWSTIKEVVGTVLIYFFGFILYVAGKFFDLAVYLSITKISELFTLPAIQSGWTLLRDFVNMVFIFVLLYIAIGTILQTLDVRRLLVRLIVIALLVNFSLVLTKVVVDASNVIAFEFYKVAHGKNPPPKSILEILNPLKPGIAGTFVNNLNMTPQVAGVDLAKLTASGPEGMAPPVVTDNKTVTQIFFSLVLIIVAAFVFFALGIMFLIRAISLAVLGVLSPLAFVSYVIPGHDQLKKWWDKLFEQAFFAPASLFWIVVVLAITSNINNFIEPTGDLGFFEGMIKTALNFAVLIGFMLASIIVAHKMSAVGASFATAAAGKMTGFVSKPIRGLTAGALKLAGQRVAKVGVGVGKRIPFVGGAAQRISGLGGGRVGKIATKVGERIAPDVKKFREAVAKKASAPLETVSKFIGGAAEVAGVKGLAPLGPTAAERKEAAKKAAEAEKTEKEKTEKEKVDAAKTNIDRISKDATLNDQQKREQTRLALEKLTVKQIANLDKDILTLASVIENLSPADLEGIARESKLGKSDIKKIAQGNLSNESRRHLATSPGAAANWNVDRDTGGYPGGATRPPTPAPPVASLPTGYSGMVYNFRAGAAGRWECQDRHWDGAAWVA